LSYARSAASLTLRHALLNANLHIGEQPEIKKGTAFGRPSWRRINQLF